MSLRPSLLVLACAWTSLAPALSAQSLNVTGTTTLPEDTAATYDTITVQSGGTLDIGGGSTITVTGALTINAGGTVLCRGKNTVAQVAGVWAGVGVTLNAGSVTIAATGQLSADGQGYRYAAGPGYAGPGADGVEGASYGGLGYSRDGSVAPEYGLPLTPTDLGSGGELYSQVASPVVFGGGAIRLIVAGTLSLEGEITADGALSGIGTSPTASATGGSIWVTTQTLTGAGKFTADGANHAITGGSSSGGRIAVYYANASGFTGFSSSTARQSASFQAESGSVIFVDTSNSRTAARVFKRFSLLPQSTATLDALTVETGGQVVLGGGATLHVNELLTVASEASVLFKSINRLEKVNGAWVGRGATLEAANVTVAAGGFLTADGQGYPWAAGPGYGGPGVGGPEGASYGGRGGANDGTVAPPYGSALEPVDLGSGGERYSAHDVYGGGAMRILVSGTLTLEGEITADGSSNAPGGSVTSGATGGSIWATIGTLTGAGKFTADAVGQTIASGHGSSGGGRIAVYYEDASGFTGFSTSTVNSSLSVSEPGTALFIDTTNGALAGRVFKRLAVETDQTLTLNELSVESGGRVDLRGGATLRVNGLLSVANGAGVLFQSVDRSAQVNGAWVGRGAVIDAGALTVATGGVLDASAQGYTNEAGPGGVPNYTGGAAGGSYGGRGGGGLAAPPYGSAVVPLALGSCGGNYQTATSSGGGAIALNVAGALVVDGDITADASGNGLLSEGSSGGSVFINANSLSGTGTISAAPGGIYQGRLGGGGGRIAVHTRTFNTFPAARYDVAVDGYSQQATKGTVHLGSTPGIEFSLPTSRYLHGTVRVGWAAYGVDGRTIVCDVRVLGSGSPTSLSSAAGGFGSTLWNTTLLPDGVYTLEVNLHRAADGFSLTQTLPVTVLNTGVTWHTGSLVGAETWAAGSVHVVAGTFAIPSGASLTIASGAVVKFVDDGGIFVASGGTLAVAGGAMPSVLTSIADDTGGDTNLDAGGSLPAAGSWTGINSVSGATVTIDPAAQVRYIVAQHAGASSGNMRWDATQIHYVKDDFTVSAGATLTIDPGAVVKFAAKKSLIIAVGGTLTADGTLAQPITFTSDRDDSLGGDTNRDGNTTAPAAGDWTGLSVSGSAHVAHARFLFGSGSPTTTWNLTAAIRTNDPAALLTLERSLVQDAFFDGVITNGGVATITNTLLVRCDRGLLVDPGSTVIVTNCTVDDCRIGLLAHGGTLTATNNIVTRSREYGIGSCCGSTIAGLSHNDVWSATPGAVRYAGITDPTGTNGNISSNPFFRDAARGIYRFAPRSPAIDAADGTAAPATDSAGVPRYDDPRTSNTGDGAAADLGAYEFADTATSPFDVVAAAVDGPEYVSVGAEATITWSVRNAGTAAITGPWRDAIRLTPVADGTTDGLLVHEIAVGGGLTLAPDQTATFSAKVTIPAGIEGRYRWTIDANAHGDVFEGNNTANNRLRSAADATLSVPVLTVGGSVTGAFAAANRSLLFKIQPTAGADVVLTLDRAGDTGFSRLLVAEERMPVDGDADFISSQWNTPDATTAISGASGAVYYVAVVPVQLPSTPLSFTLSAAPASFALTRIDVATGSNRGSVTVPLIGTGLRRDATVALVRSGNATISAGEVHFVDATRVDATFDLAGAATGAWDVRIEQNGVARTLAGAFTIGAGAAGELRTSVLMPPNVRAGREFIAWIEYQNVGQTDLELPIIGVRSPDGVPLSLTSGHTASDTGDLSLLAIAPAGPPWILAPGRSGRAPVYCIAQSGNNRIETTITTTDSTAAMDWSGLRNELRPTVNVPADWDAAFDVTAATYGPTTGDYARWAFDAVRLRHERTGDASPDPAPALEYYLFNLREAAQARIEGHVHLGGAAQPLSGVVVSMVDESGAVAGSAVSARNGFVRFTSLDATTYTPEFEDYLPPAPLSRLTLSSGGPVVTAEWLLRAGGEIRGVVLLDESSDRAAFTVAASDSAGRHAAVSAVDELGRYHLRSLAAGVYTVALVGDGIVPDQRSGIVVTEGAVSSGPALNVAASGRISGVVTDASTGNPLIGATVVATAAGRPPGAAVTGEGGAYTIIGLATGSYTVTANAASFVEASATNVVLGAAFETTGVNLALSRGATLQGTVTSAGAPVARALVAVGDDTRIVGAATTAVDGTYSITGLPAGTWDTSVDHAAFVRTATNVVLSSGATTMQNFALVSAPALTTRVEIAGTGAGIHGAMLRLFGPGNTESQVFTDENGNVVFGRLADGSYVVTLEDGSQRQSFTVAGGVVTGNLEFAIGGGAVKGYVRAADGISPGQAIVKLVADGQTVVSQLTSPTGEYAFNHVAPGTYGLRFAAFDAFFPARDAITVTAGATTTVPEVSAGNASLEVTVRDGGIAVGAGHIVFLRGDESALGGYALRLAETDASGRATFAGLVPSTYQINAVTSARSSGIVAQTVATGSNAVVLDVGAMGTLRGHVRDELGAPLTAVDLLIHPTSDPTKIYVTGSNEDGSYRIETLPVGSYDVWAADRAPGPAAVRRTPVFVAGISITDGADIVRDFTLATSPIGLSGAISSADGSFPLAAVVEVRTGAGLVLATALMQADGTFALPRLPGGSYSLAARAHYFAIEPRAVTVVTGVSQTGVELDARSVGGFGVLLDEAGVARFRGMVAAAIELPDFTEFDSAWAQRAYNALAEWARRKLGEPPYKKPNLSRPAGLFDTTCPCPEAIAAWQRALYYQKYADLQWDQWHEYWEGRQQEIWASVGLFGANLLKFSGDLAAAAIKTPQLIAELQQSQRNALQFLNSVKRQPGPNFAATYNAQEAFRLAGETISRLEKLVANLGTPGNLLASGIQDESGNFAGSLGNFQAIANMLRDPIGSFSTDQGLVGFVESVNGCVNNVSNAISVLDGLLQAAGKTGFGPLAGLAGKLGPFTNGLQTLIEGGRALSASINASAELANYEAIYDYRIGLRDGAYRTCLDLLAACRQRNNCDDPNKPKPPAPNGGKPGGSGNSGGVGSLDPNDKASSGVGAAGYVTPGSAIHYHIRFENVATASAAAQLVTVTDQLANSLDWSTFELVSIGFNGVTLTPPAGSQNYTARAAVASDPNPVDVAFSLDPQTGVAFWSMRSVDAVTGDYPEDPFAGFLPPNDASGRGEGHVSFLVKPKADLADGAAFTNQARIVFDANAPIDTNIVTNTIDRTAANATIHGLPGATGTKFRVSWTGNDVGSGVVRYELWVSTDGGAFSLWSGNIATTSVVFNGEAGRTYAFYVRAFDALGQSTALAPVAQAATTTVAGHSRLINISTRGLNGSGAGAMIVGFVVRSGASASTAKPILLRGVGPTLGTPPFNVPGSLADPRLDLFNRDGGVIFDNNDWALAANGAQLPGEFDRLFAFGLPANSKDAAILTSLAPELYTARASGANNTTGVTLIEAYDADTTFSDIARPQIINLSTRGFVGRNDQVMIAGFVISGATPKTLLIRAVGETLGTFNVPGVVADPEIRLVDSAGATIASNDNWGDGNPALVGATAGIVSAFPLPPGSRDAALVMTLNPGIYTVIVSGKNNTTGVALAEIYDADP